MPELLENRDYSFDTVLEVREKMENAEDLHRLIAEETVQDLKRVYIHKRFYCKCKRLLDIILSGIGLLLLLVPFAVLAAVIYLDDPGPAIFAQYRIGRQGKRFKLYKFRTMKQDTPKYLSTREVENPDLYITRVGHILRKCSLDELPQLVNVLRGDMSLVGPRPLIADEYEIHAMRMRFGVYSVRPGVTGLAQIHGRDLVSPADKVRWDVKYLQCFGFWTDLKTLIQTIPKIFGGEGIVEGYKDQPRENKQHTGK